MREVAPVVAQDARGTPGVVPRLRGRRQQHPKAYLAWLARDCNAKKCSMYSEVSRSNQPCGATALARLDWTAALSHGPHCLYLRSFVVDLADALNEVFPNALSGAEAPLTSRHTLPTNPVLRNL